jgi:hypothetical protein
MQGKEQDSRETERERESVRDRVLLEMRDSIGNKKLLEKTFVSNV